MHHHFRNLIIIQGDEQLIDHQLACAIKVIDGDWVTIAAKPILSNITSHFYLEKEAKLLLGREFKHAIFDARQGFNLDAFAILSGTLMAGSISILLLPNNMADWQDQDSQRWNEQSNAILVPNFITHLNRIIQQQQDRYPNNTFLLFIDENNNQNDLLAFIKQHQLIVDNQLPFNDNTQQQTLLHQLISSPNDIIVLTAKRGRGKSALAGMFACEHQCWVTAPNRNAVTTLMKFASPDTIFFAPDELIIQLQNSDYRPDWLIIDEAAMIPLPIITKLINQSYNVLLTSTVDGYEGTGQGLLLKLCNQQTQQTQHKNVAYCTLNAPIRWLDNDPLEYFVDNLIITGHPDHSNNKIDNNITIIKLTQAQLVESQSRLNAFFGLLKSAHYRTTLIDLRRLLDAHNLWLYSAQLSTQQQEQIAGVLVAIKEGGLAHELVDDILKGYRRPRGNLVAQSLVAHAGEKQAAILRSIRINRIAVQEEMRKQGIATQLISQLIADAQAKYYDFISVSFAYSRGICQFWLKLGFTIVHIGTHQEASSGSYSIMAIYPINDTGRNLCHEMSLKLARNWYWLKHRMNINLPIVIDHDQQLTAADKLELSLFATTSYSYSASLAVLSRLANRVKQIDNAEINQLAPLLLDLLANTFSENCTVQKYQLSGKNALLKLLRTEVHQLIRVQELFNE